MQAKAQLEAAIAAVTSVVSADIDPQETAEWLEAWDDILADPQRAGFLINALREWTDLPA